MELPLISLIEFHPEFLREDVDYVESTRFPFWSRKSSSRNQLSFDEFN